MCSQTTKSTHTFAIFGERKLTKRHANGQAEKQILLILKERNLGKVKSEKTNLASYNGVSNADTSLFLTQLIEESSNQNRQISASFRQLENLSQTPMSSLKSRVICKIARESQLGFVSG
jgi:hypothetical protein